MLILFLLSLQNNQILNNMRLSQISVLLHMSGLIAY